MSQGAHYAGDGETTSYSGNIGFEATSGSYINLAAEYREHEHTNRGDIDPRVVDPGRIDPDAGGTFPNTNMPFAAGLSVPQPDLWRRRLRDQTGLDECGRADRRQHRVLRTLTAGDKHAASFENYRLPSRVVVHRSGYRRSHVTSVPSASVRAKRPRSPTWPARSASRASWARWNWDLASTYGEDEIDMFTRDSANASLYADTGQTPVNFYDGTYTSTQWTTNLDLTREIELGMAGPMNLAFGAEYREETWEAVHGDEGSRYFEGGQSFPGISTSDAGKHDRDVAAVYVDVVIEPLEKLRLDIAGRYEDYSDFGDTSVGKLSARYELTDTFALRGTVSTGFRAPTHGRGVLLRHQRGPDHGLRADAAERAGHGAAGPRRRAATGEVDQLLGGLRGARREEPGADVRPVPGGSAQPHRRHQHVLRHHRWPVVLTGHRRRHHRQRQRARSGGHGER